jgi:dethiobiotin synthetase
MTSQAIPGLFITGTDTGVGKTQVAAKIAAMLRRQGRRVGVYKPVASGCARRGEQLFSDDAWELWQAAGQPGELAAVCPQRFAAPLAPPLAARAEGRPVDADLLRTGLDYWRARSEVLLVEGAGGLMSPLSDEAYVADLAGDLGFPLIVVAPNVLGVINQALQTLITAANVRGGLQVAGVILNEVREPTQADLSTRSNAAELQTRCPVPLLAQLGWRADAFDRSVDWYELACRRQ